jgi:2-dehydropantoate 2-reductase
VEMLETYCRQVIHDTKNNKSSMLQDVLAQRKTEVDYLNGHVVAMGRRYNIDCPVNAHLCRQIQDLTANFT